MKMPVSALPRAMRLASRQPPLTYSECSSKICLSRNSSIAAAAYDRNRRILRVGYRAGKAAHRGGTYDYFDVPPPVVRQFLGAESLGRFVNGQIKPHYKYKKVN
jgi:hypothetical protein